MPESEILLKYTTDKSSFAQTLQSEERLTSAQRAYNLEVLEANQQLKKTQRVLEEYRQEIDSLTAAEIEAERAIMNRVQAQSKTPGSVGGGGAAGGGRFDVVSQQVGIYGDVESQVRTLTGALGYMGGEAGQTAEQVINVGAELFAVAEAGPKLAAGVGDVALRIGESVPLVGSLATGLLTLVPALGVTGAAIAAIALPIAGVVAVIGGLILAIKSLGDAAEEARKQVDEQYNASKKRIEIEREIADFQRENDKAGAQARLDELKRQQEDANKLLTEIYVARDEINKAYEELGAALNPEERAKLGAQGEERQKQLEAETKLFQERQKEIDALEAAIPGIADATAEEEALAAAREGGTDAAKEAEKAEASRQKAVDDAQRQIEQAQEKARAAQDNYNKALADAATTARNSAQDIRTKLKDALVDLATSSRRQAIDDTTKQNDDLTDIRVAQFRAEQDAFMKHGRALRDILKNANRSQEDLLAERDFLALDSLSKQTARQIEDEAQATEDVAAERAIANRNEFTDFQTQTVRLRNERLTDFRRQQMDLRNNSERELRDVQVTKRRQLEQARDALQRELDMAKRGIENKLQLEAAYWQQSAGMIPTAGGAGGGGTGFTPAQQQAIQNISMNTRQQIRGR